MALQHLDEDVRHTNFDVLHLRCDTVFDLRSTLRLLRLPAGLTGGRSWAGRPTADGSGRWQQWTPTHPPSDQVAPSFRGRKDDCCLRDTCAVDDEGSFEKASPGIVSALISHCISPACVANIYAHSDAPNEHSVPAPT